MCDAHQLISQDLSLKVYLYRNRKVIITFFDILPFE